jgi:urease accessory protein
VDPLADAGRAGDGLTTTCASGWTDTEVSVRLRRGAGGVVRADGVMCSAPVWFRWDGATLWMVGSGASPVGEDRVRVRVEVGPGVSVAVRSVAATMVYAARGAGTRWDTEISVADGASLDWRPEPVIITERARHESTTTVHATAAAEVTLDEVVVLGRAGESAGPLRSTLDVRVDGAPVLLTSIDTSLPAWSGPAGSGGADIVAHRLRLGDHADPSSVSVARAALLTPGDRCRLAVASGFDVREATRSLDALLPA